MEKMERWMIRIKNNLMRALKNGSLTNKTYEEVYSDLSNYVRMERLTGITLRVYRDYIDYEELELMTSAGEAIVKTNLYSTGAILSGNLSSKNLNYKGDPNKVSMLIYEDDQVDICAIYVPTEKKNKSRYLKVSP